MIFFYQAIPAIGRVHLVIHPQGLLKLRAQVLGYKVEWFFPHGAPLQGINRRRLFQDPLQALHDGRLARPHRAH
jgi:hypothetical protein